MINFTILASESDRSVPPKTFPAVVRKEFG